MKLLIVLTLTLFLSAFGHAGDVKPNGKAVLITGASSGLGLTMAKTLADKGVYVYAGARNKADIDRLSAMKNIMGVRLDVTKPEDIAAAVDLVEKQGRGLYGLVNNAGVFLHAPMIEVSEKDLAFLMDVNVYGPYRVTKAFAPMIIESKGRITTTGSISGVMSGPMFGPYSMTKHAVEAYTDALYSEMRKFDVEVSVVDPGNFKSNIMKNMHKRMQRMKNNNEKTLYETEYQSLIGFTKQDRSAHKEPTPVANAVVDALFSENPKRRYMVVPNQVEADMAIRSMMRRAVQLNVGHEFTNDREALISSLDSELKAVSGQSK